MEKLLELELNTVPELFEEVQYRFFKNFKAKKSIANQYAFFDEFINKITIEEINNFIKQTQYVYVYMYYKKSIRIYKSFKAFSILNSLYEDNALAKNDSDVVFVFDNLFRTLIVFSDDELNHQIYVKIRQH